ncbi:hypothetical protein HKX48_008081 [Thoreauomyces humboldtii]|nr:hypothetical protein HKX48_008081 [Thoreauomyces humboldtii]
MARKTHEEASGFSVVPLQPTATSAAAHPAQPSQPSQPSQTAPATQPHPSAPAEAHPLVHPARSATKRNKDTADATGAPPPAEQRQEGSTTGAGDGIDDGPARKRSRMRHRTKATAVSTTEEGDGTVPVTVPGRPAPVAPLGGKVLTRAEKDALRRRTRRERNREKKMICYLCRNPGHSVGNCPKTNQTPSDPLAPTGPPGICYKCGSPDHTSSQCRDKKIKGYPFAHCYVCDTTGHIASACPDNERGMYPNGGSCKFCGSVRHFARDCKPAVQEAGVTTLGKIDLKQGGDDDDVFVALRRMDTDISHTATTGKGKSRTKSSVEGSDASLREGHAVKKEAAGGGAPKKRVVKF